MPLEPRHFNSDGEVRVKCIGTVSAEFWENDAESVYTEKDSQVRVLEVKESQWPGKNMFAILTSDLYCQILHLPHANSLA